MMDMVTKWQKEAVTKYSLHFAFQVSGQVFCCCCCCSQASLRSSPLSLTMSERCGCTVRAPTRASYCILHIRYTQGNVTRSPGIVANGSFATSEIKFCRLNVWHTTSTHFNFPIYFVIRAAPCSRSLSPVGARTRRLEYNWIFLTFRRQFELVPVHSIRILKMAHGTWFT